ncbi:GL10592 [Drosophila persimilis]|uniref:GL10592 n=1 Tax=Drosophila persimilis TaxID=7234 RepID=B4GB43_DROPE|nr:GL10592 [Drosophila persimilis]
MACLSKSAACASFLTVIATAFEVPATEPRIEHIKWRQRQMGCGSAAASIDVILRHTGFGHTHGHASSQRLSSSNNKNISPAEGAAIVRAPKRVKPIFCSNLTAGQLLQLAQQSAAASPGQSSVSVLLMTPVQSLPDIVQALSSIVSMSILYLHRTRPPRRMACHRRTTLAYRMPASQSPQQQQHHQQSGGPQHMAAQQQQQQQQQAAAMLPAAQQQQQFDPFANILGDARNCRKLSTELVELCPQENLEYWCPKNGEGPMRNRSEDEKILVS